MNDSVTAEGDEQSDEQLTSQLTDHAWLDAWALGWDPDYSLSFLPSARAWSLSVVLGRRSFAVSSPNAFGGALARRATDWYGHFSLNFPLDILRPSPRPDLRTAAQRSDIVSGPNRAIAIHSAVAYPMSEPSDQAVQGVEDPAPDKPSEQVSFPPDARQARAATPAKGARSERDVLLLVHATTFSTQERMDSSGERARLESLVRRSRTSGLVPELRMRGVLGFDRTTSSEEAIGIYPGETTTRGGRDSLLEARLTFRLDRLVYGASESTLQRHREQLAQESRERIAEAVELVTEWFETKRAAADPGLLPEEREQLLRSARLLLARANLATLGWFEGEATLRELGIEDFSHSAESDSGKPHASPRTNAEPAPDDSLDR